MHGSLNAKTCELYQFLLDGVTHRHWGKLYLADRIGARGARLQRVFQKNIVNLVELFEASIPNFDRVSAPRNFNGRYRFAVIDVFVGKMFGKTFRINRCRSDNQLEFWSAGQEPLHHTKQEVDVERPFVCFVNDERVVLSKVFVRLRFGEQDSIGHQFDERVAGNLVVESNFIPDCLTKRRVEFFGNACGNGSGGNTARLGVSDGAVDATSDFKANFWYLCGLPGPRFAAHDNDLIVPNEIGNLLSPLDDGQVIVVSEVERFEQCLPPVRVDGLHRGYCSRLTVFFETGFWIKLSP